MAGMVFVMKIGVTVRVDRTKELAANIAKLPELRVLVGFPRETAPRKGEPITNAELGYIHNYGSASQRIPPRPALVPGVEAALPAIERQLQLAAVAAVTGRDPLVSFHAAGLLAQASIKSVIRAGIPPPLAPRTVQQRIARRADPSWRAKKQAAVDANVAAGRPPGAGLFTPLIDTGSFINAVNYVIRKKDRTVAGGPGTGSS